MAGLYCMQFVGLAWPHVLHTTKGASMGRMLTMTMQVGPSAAHSKGSGAWVACGTLDWLQLVGLNELDPTVLCEQTGGRIEFVLEVGQENL